MRRCYAWRRGTASPDEAAGYRATRERHRRRREQAEPGRRRERAKPRATTLVLVRHGVTAQTGPLLSGRMPGIDLSEKGIEQAEAPRERLAALPIAAVYASPIERTTADRRGHRDAPRARRCCRSTA